MIANNVLRQRTAVTTILRCVRAGVLLGLDSLCGLVPRGHRNSVLVVRLDAIGDFFLWMQSGAADVARYSRRAGRNTALLANSAWADYARETGLWDKVVPLEPKRFMWNPMYRLRILCAVRRLGLTTLIQPRSARVFLLEDAISRVCGATSRVGNAGTLVNMSRRVRQLGNKCYDSLIAVDERTSTHETRRNQQFVERLTGEGVSRFELRPQFAGGEVDTIVIALGAGDIGRVWPNEKLTRLINYIRENYAESRITLVGRSSEHSLADKLLRSVRDIENKVGQTSIVDYVELIAAARLVICNESSAYHIAMAYGKDVVCFLGGGHYGQFAPYPASDESTCRAVAISVSMECFGCNWNCIFPRSNSGAFRCVASISVDNAIAEVDRLLCRRRSVSSAKLRR